MALFSRRRRQATDDADDDFDDFDELPPEPARPAARTDTLPPSRLRDWEIPAAYGAAALVALIAILELVVTKGKGAPKHPNSILPAISLVLAIAQVATIRVGNRLITGSLTMVAALLAFSVTAPDSLAVPRVIACFAALIYGFVVFQRHSRAQRAAMPPRARRGGGSSAGASTRSGRGKKAEEPTGIPASRRYTPPKPKEKRSPRKRD